MVGELYLLPGACWVPIRLPRWGGAGDEGGRVFRHERVHYRGRALPQHSFAVDLPRGPVGGPGAALAGTRKSPRVGLSGQ